jgi:flagellar basal body-associated protein FliL
MEHRRSPLILIAVGVALLGLSFASFVHSDGRSVWTEEKAVQYQQAAATFHQLAHEAGHLGGSEDSTRVNDNLQQAQSDFEQLRTELESARRGSIHWPVLLRIAGTTLAVAGAISFFATRRKGSRGLADFHRVRESVAGTSGSSNDVADSL